jgi:Chalcone isomerase-like
LHGGCSVAKALLAGRCTVLVKAHHANPIAYGWVPPQNPDANFQNKNTAQIALACFTYPLKETLTTIYKTCISALAALLISGAALAAATDVGGVKVEDTADVQGTKLQLNGAGVRYKAIFKVYTIAMYTGKKVASAEELAAAPGPKRISMTMLREIDSAELGKAFTKGFEDNSSKSELSKMIPGLLKMSQIFSDQKKMVAGDVVLLDWIPGTGMVVSAKGKVQGEPFKEVEFFNAMARIWLGNVPADAKLKDMLLGKAS